MKNSNQILSVAAFFGAAIAQANATVIFDDAFGSGTGSWHRASTLDTLGNSAGELTVVRNTAAPTSSDGLIGRSFDAQTLGVGETIRLTLDYRQSAASNAIFRVGLYDFGTSVSADNWSNGTIGSFSGYYTFVRDAATTSLARYETAGSSTTAAPPTAAGNGITTSGSTTFYDINQNGAVNYKVLFEITRTSAGQIDTLFTLTSGVTTHFSITGSTTTNLLNTFDTAVLRIGGGTASYDNVKVEVIPEPAAGLLGGLGLLAVLRRRR